MVSIGCNISFMTQDDVWWLPVPVVSAGHHVEVELAGDESQAGGEEDQGQAQDWPGEDGGVDGSQASTDQPDNEQERSQQMTSNDDWCQTERTCKVTSEIVVQ